MKTELLAPAGDIEKVKVAFLYGADAVYIGGKSFSLRARASRFGLKEINEAAEIAHKNKKKLYVTCNIVPHEADFEGLEAYLNDLEKAAVDAIIVSDPYVVQLAKSRTALEVHLSTQQSVTNSLQTDFWYSQGVKRIVLARELSLTEIKDIKANTEADLEVFVHGGMCSSYSGRCTLSNVMSLRDANRGGCAHSCRWEYDLFQNDRLFAGDFQIASRDLVALEHVPALLDIGVSSLKIEGRMKSIHYIATVVNSYRRLIDDYYEGKLRPIDEYFAMIEKAENRQAGSGFFQGNPLEKQQLYSTGSTQPTKDFCGLVLDYDLEHKLVLVEQRNYFEATDILEVFRPEGDPLQLTAGELFSDTGEKLDVARHPLQKVKFHSEIPLKPYDILRRVNT
ncbi:MAG: U32 family peptidase [Bacilli bacterium]|nr:U32 family peptidase [Bacilli bacterium]MBN2696814.1 U32 family peptidase [Bacilli bacterium]